MDKRNITITLALLMTVAVCTGEFVTSTFISSNIFGVPNVEPTIELMSLPESVTPISARELNVSPPTSKSSLTYYTAEELQTLLNNIDLTFESNHLSDQ